MKLRICTLVYLFVAFLPLTAHAVTMDSFLVSTEGERDFETDPKKYTGEIASCGFVIVDTLENKDIVRVTIIKERTGLAENNKPKYKTHLRAEVGEVDKRTGRYSKFDIENGEIFGDKISRKINIKEFPSNSLQLGRFADRLINLVFTISLEYQGSDKQEKLEKKFFSESYPLKEHHDYISCVTILHT